ncbi:DNA polymerase I [Clostridium sp. D2Q-11]|uniref:DNA polymerase I n=1 Tax=Anaeromonas frigoriresistens TaxID=2683708 RepID=A0A942Z5A0_9FIRM|nr:DNA polymerase I [Anaeromonas frigoriresistens]MBS4537201.1 DNA polymerase I [Anaeromonas frigoriresistens]
MDNKRVVLIDGNSLLHRAYHALPPLKNKDGLYTNGVYGFMTMIYKILDDYEPGYISVAFDRKGPTFRHKEYTDYKAGRKKTPDDLGMQFPILKDVLDKMNIHRVEIDGYEADDIVGTLAKHCSNENMDVIVVTGDKDYLQLVDENIKVLITKKGMTNLETYDEKAMLDRYELTAAQFIDLKGLMGDKSDNIPGVPGVGEKTGIKLLKEYDSIEGIYNNIENVSGKKLKERLIENKSQAFMSRRLGEIVINVPLEINLEELKKEKPNEADLLKLYSELEFKSFIGKIDEKVIEEAKESLQMDINILAYKENLQKEVNNINEGNDFIFKFVIGGTDSLTDDILGLAFKYREKDSFYISFKNEEDLRDKLPLLKDIFINPNISKSSHDIKEDILILFRYGIDIYNISFDTVIAQYLIEASQKDYSLKNLASEYLNIHIKNSDDLLGTGRKKKSLIDISENDLSEFMASKLNIIYKAKKILMDKIIEYDMKELYENIEMPLVKVLADMQFQGFKVDINQLKELGNEFDDKINNLTETIYDYSGEEFNINSPKQMGYILFEKLELPVIKKTKTGYSTNAEVLDKLHGKHPIIEKILEYRQIVKLKSTYVDGLIPLINKKTNKVHSSFNQTITTTGRISSTNPNLQNIPIKTEEGRKIRKVFVADNEEHKLVDADYSQIELRVLAHISNESKLIDAFENKEDIHTKTASEVFEVEKDDVTSIMRSRAKAVNFGIVYGISDYGLSRDLNISRKEAKKYIDNYLKNYNKVKEYMDDIVKEAKGNGYVKTLLNRRRFIPELQSRNFNVRSFGERTAMNTPIQGSAADIIKIAMLNVYRELKNRNLKSKLILQVHDELIIETYKDELEEVKSLLKDLMENAVELKVPLTVDMQEGDSWYETK